MALSASALAASNLGLPYLARFSPSETDAMVQAGIDPSPAPADSSSFSLAAIRALDLSSALWYPTSAAALAAVALSAACGAFPEASRAAAMAAWRTMDSVSRLRRASITAAV